MPSYMTGFGKNQRGQILYNSPSFTLGTLADQTAMKSTAYSITEDFRLLKTKWCAHFEGHTVGEGPLIMGIADAELSAAEIAEALTAAPIDRNDHTALEKSHRPVFPLAQIAPGTDQACSRLPESGLFVDSDIRWTFSNDDGWCWFVFNDSGGALTTGSVLKIFAKHFGVWVS